VRERSRAVFALPGMMPNGLARGQESSGEKEMPVPGARSLYAHRRDLRLVQYISRSDTGVVPPSQGVTRRTGARSLALPDSVVGEMSAPAAPRPRRTGVCTESETSVGIEGLEDAYAGTRAANCRRSWYSAKVDRQWILHPGMPAVRCDRGENEDARRHVSSALPEHCSDRVIGTTSARRQRQEHIPVCSTRDAHPTICRQSERLHLRTHSQEARTARARSSQGRALTSQDAPLKHPGEAVHQRDVDTQRVAGGVGQRG
jgi:hypothetical protein